MYANFFEAIKDLNYVVQRNWDNLPESCEVDGHNDIDLFVSETDRSKLEYIVECFNLSNMVDIRSEKDCYYTIEIGAALLASYLMYNKIKIPVPVAHFLSLCYHSLVHKKDNPYEKKLKEVFLDIYKPIQCIDKGVGYYV